jgi:protein-tyrosine phosphatase
MKKRVIFVCSANYYRSRYAEHYFNWLAEQEQLGWKADSRGLMVGFWGNIGPISHHTKDALQRRGIPLDDETREPKALTLGDLAEADLVVAVKEAEHRAMMIEQFPLWEDRIEYWHVDDLDCAEAHEALTHLECQIHALVARLQMAEGHNGSNVHAGRRGIASD